MAEAHQRGRRLYIGTANLDAPRFVVWNMGLIASSGRPDALELFRKVMLASASIPVAFPPVFFDVELTPGGPRYDEMHVDGGVGARVFLNGGVFRGSVIRERGGQGGLGKEDIFVIHNGQLMPIPDPVPRALASIAVRVIDASGRAAAVGDLFRIYGYAQGEKAHFPVDHDPGGREDGQRGGLRPGADAGAVRPGPAPGPRGRRVVHRASRAAPAAVNVPLTWPSRDCRTPH